MLESSAVEVPIRHRLLTFLFACGVSAPLPDLVAVAADRDQPRSAVAGSKVQGRGDRARGGQPPDHHEALVPEPPPLVFGIYPSAASAADAVSPDEPDKIRGALARLQGERRRPFRVRAYVEYRGAEGDRVGKHFTPEDVEQYLGDGRRLDLVAMYQASNGDVSGFEDFVRCLVDQYGAVTDTLQITEESDVLGYGMDGDMPNARAALVRGILAAKRAARQLGHAHLQVGFNVVDPDEDFFRKIGRLGGAEWAAAVDYVGIDLFPDVWDSAATPDALRGSVVATLKWLRERALPRSGLSADVSLIVTEHGWPTGRRRSPERQTKVLETVIRAVHEHRGAFNVRGYTAYQLRDANSSSSDLFDQFGLVRDDYSPNPRSKRTGG